MIKPLMQPMMSAATRPTTNPTSIEVPSAPSPPAYIDDITSAAAIPDRDAENVSDRLMPPVTMATIIASASIPNSGS